MFNVSADMSHMRLAAVLLLLACCLRNASQVVGCDWANVGGCADSLSRRLDPGYVEPTCQELCMRASGTDCSKETSESWEEGGTFCSIKYPSSSSTDPALGRVSYVGVYTVPKDILLSLVTQYNQVKIIRALGGHVSVGNDLGSWPPPELGYFISLCFPRVSILWEWLNGRRLAPATSCCNPECHWEEMLKAPKLPTLQQLLAKAVSSAEDLTLSSSTHCTSLRHKLTHNAYQLRVQTHNPGRPASLDAGVGRACGGAGVESSCASATEGRGEWVSSGSSTNSGGGGWATPIVAFAAHSMQDPSWWHIRSWLSVTSTTQWPLWLLAPNLLVAREALELAAARPWLSLYLCNAAVLLAGAEWVSLAASCLHPASVPARALLAATNFLFTFVIVAATLVGVTLLGAVGAWLPVLQPFALLLAWAALLAMPLLSGLFVLVVLSRHVRVELMDALEAISRVPQLIGAVPPHARAPWAPVADADAAGAVHGSEGQGVGGAAGVDSPAGGQANGETRGNEDGRSGWHTSINGLGLRESVRGRVQEGGSRRLGTLPGLNSPHLAQRQRLQQLFQQQQQLQRAQGQLPADRPPQGPDQQQQVLAPLHEAPQWQELGLLGLVTHYLAQMRGVTQRVHELFQSSNLIAGPNQPAPAAAIGAITARQSTAAAATGAMDAGIATGGTSNTMRGGSGAARGEAGVAGRDGVTSSGGRSWGATSAAARQSAAAAALAAIHWPPPLVIPPWLEERHTVPNAFKCPITLSMMREPAQASSGVTYEKGAIFQWLSVHRVDPVTQAPLKRHRLTPNLNLRNMVDEWVAMCEAEYLASTNAAATSGAAASSPIASGATSSTSSADEDTKGCAVVDHSQGGSETPSQSVREPRAPGQTAAGGAAAVSHDQEEAAIQGQGRMSEPQQQLQQQQQRIEG